MKQAGQKSVKEELPKQRKGPKRAEKCRLKVPTHIWEREAGVRAALLQNPGNLWDAKADGVLPLAGNWSKTGADPIFDHSWKTS